MMKAIIVAVIGSFALAAAGQAQQLPANLTDADCKLRIDVPTGNWVINGYDPFGSDAPTGTYDLMFVNEGGRECKFYPIFQTDGSVLGLAQGTDTSRILYTLLDTYGEYDATPIGGRTVRRNTNRAVVVAPHSQQLVRYILNIADPTIPGDGMFTQRLILSAENVTGEPLAQRQIVLGLNVLPSAVLGLAGEFHRNRGQADIDLGELREGIPAIPLQLQVHSTRGYKLKVQSLNTGKLRLAGTDWAIPYQMMIDGRQITFGSSASYGTHGRVGTQVASLPVAFRVGNVAERRAGTYSDTVTITISIE
jgi:hypothetical protein